jgi:hypothetical protein
LTKRLVAAAAFAVLSAGASTAQAQTKHYFSQSNFLYSFDSTNPTALTSVEMKLGGNALTGGDARVAGLAFDPSGTLWGSSASGKFFTIDTTTGAITSKFTTSSAQTIATFDFRQNGSTLEILAAQTTTGGVSNLRRYDAAGTGTPLIWSSTGTSNVSLNLPGAQANNAGDPASGYDAATGKYYIVKGGASSGSTDDFSLRSFSVAGETFSSPLSTGLEWSSSGSAWFGNQLNFGYRPGVDAGSGNWNLPGAPGNGNVFFGRLNTTTGAFTQDVSFTGFTIAGQPVTGPSFGYAVAAIPEPESYAMMLAGLGLLGFIARRRKQTAV